MMLSTVFGSCYDRKIFMKQKKIKKPIELGKLSECCNSLITEKKELSYPNKINTLCLNCNLVCGTKIIYAPHTPKNP